MKKYLVWAVVLLSAVWTATHWGEFADIKHRLDEVLVFSVGFLLAELCFDVGLAILATCVGKSVLAALWQRSKVLPAMLVAVRDSKWAKVGFYLNWIGAFGATFVVLLGALWFLPGVAKAAALVLGLDILATFALRIPLWLKLREEEPNVSLPA